MKRTLLTALTLMAAFAGAAEPAVPAAPLSGIDIQYIDPAVRAQDDFFTYLNGKWLKSTEIPADKSSWGTFAKLRDDVQPQIRAIIEQARRDKQAGADARKIGDLYASFMNEHKRDELGYKPLTGELAAIRRLHDKKGMPALIAHLSAIGVDTPYAIYVGPDGRDSSKYAAHIAQGGLGLPDRDYYLRQDDARMADTKARYERHVATMLALVGRKDAAEAARAVVGFETELARAQWSKVENRDRIKRYNKVALARLGELAPGYDWNAAAAAAGIGNKVDYVIVSQPSYLSALDTILQKTDLAAVKAYFEWQLVRSYANYLSQPFVDASFAFYGTTLTGVTENRPLWKRAVSAVEGALGDAVGQRYVQQYFPAERKARMQVLVANLLEAYRQSIATLDWMGPQTKEQAQAKLAKVMPKIGYPDKWRDYGALAISRDDLVGNIMRVHNVERQYRLGKLGKPVDREEWGMTPQTVNAYYNASMNEIVFPASILQPPFFDMRADDAVNYGAIGAVIGHEISHGFDDQGSQSDGDGNLRDWWSAADRAAFKAKTDMLVKQYNGYAPLPGYHVNGALTLGENIGDNSGIAIAYKAYHLSLGGKSAPVIDGLTGDQRFFMGFGQVWRMTMRDARQIVQLKTDPHAPGQFRANGTLRNQAGFYDAFGVKPGDKMYLPPQQRVTIW